MDKSIKIESTRLLVVEGKDECNFFKALLKHLKIDGVQLVDIGGKDKFKTEFQLLCNLENFNKIKRLGFIRDAETNPAKSAFDSICGVLKKHNLPIPVNINKIRNDTDPYVGIFIMPDNSGEGMLENLCLKTIESLPQYDCVDGFISCFVQHQPQNEKEKFNEPKAKVQTYLASRSPIVESLGLGAQKGYWDFNHLCLDDMKKFLESLFPEGILGQDSKAELTLVVKKK
ncbi:hypothetical protein AUJ95_01325 [Candidatus Desantisbacteria bacterium CG2_30_40_21]|uniref:DUF4435 domain-containing protein n=1 Tax=Candidatus Desantisbacteria bacterium CG2_30_40_21 TaxID=1817895 RepID=A0A1J5E371_9BACT|nr:MAG: hypothetical protein AUJ95_01325 [Candidatus Desantisbacteria bacterium CG2_30_40_21]